MIGWEKLKPVGAEGREELKEGGFGQEKLRPVGAEWKEELMEAS